MLALGVRDCYVTSVAKNQTVGQLMGAWRKAKGDISQREASDRAGFSQFVWSVYERDEAKDVTLEIAMALVRLTAGTPQAISLEMFPPSRRSKSKSKKHAA